MKRFVVLTATMLAFGLLGSPADAVGAPEILSPATGSNVAGASGVSVSGTADAGSMVDVVNAGSGAVLGSAVTNGSQGVGTWNVTLTLGNGDWSINALQRGVGVPSSSVSFHVDAVRPLSPDVDNPTSNAIFGPGQNARIEGSAADDSGVLAVQLEFWLLNQLKKRVNAECTCGGTDATFSYDFNPDIPGFYALKAATYDLAGNRSESTTVTFFDSGVRTGPQVPQTPKGPEVPKPPIIYTPDPGEIVPGGESGNEEEIRGTAPPGARVQVFETNAGLGTINNWRTTVADPRTGVWAVEHDFADGRYTIAARTIDARGRISPLSTRVSFYVDGLRPTLSVENESDELPITFLPTEPVALEGVINDNRGLLAVQLEYWFLDHLALRENALCDCSGRRESRWVDHPPLTMPGYYYVKITGIDAAGNKSNTEVVTFIKVA